MRDESTISTGMCATERKIELRLELCIQPIVVHAEANKYLKANYRQPWIVPEKV